MDPIINVGVKAARRAGSLLIRYIDRLEQVKVEKKGRSDLVSEIDRMAEEDIIETIRHLYPNHAILAEESGAQSSSTTESDGSELEWIIDPLDGTSNYLRGHPHFCVSIATRKNGRIEHGIIFDPLRDEIYTTVRGQGAQLNSRRIRVSNQGSFGNSIVTTAPPVRNLNQFDPWMKSYKSLIPRVDDVRTSGSAALDLAYVASGKIDAYYELGLKPWDIAAGSLMVREAGGLVSDFQGQQGFLESGHIVAGNNKIFNDLLSLIKSRTGSI